MFTEKEYGSENFKDLTCSGESFESIEFYQCTFQNCNFEKTIFKKCIFTECTFKQCNLSLMKIPTSTFIETEFRSSKMVGINWTSISSQVFSVEFHECVLNYSIFDSVNLNGTKMLGCTIHEADFSNASLKEAVCTDTDFAGSTFSDTNLTKADFRSARNYGMVPADNVLTKAKFSVPEVLCLLDAMGVEFE
ncbi:MAG: pentapeptide repeat-containing protein [Candidatus Gracilibacteria bacterium]